MKLDKLRALIRLANNNNSEGEANAAARKVCRILASNEFTITEGFRFKTAQEKVFRGGNPGGNKGTWNDVKRNDGEPAWRAKPPDPKPPYNTTEYDQYESFRDMGFNKEFFDNLFRKAGVGFGGFKQAPTDDEWREAHAEKERNEKTRKAKLFAPAHPRKRSKTTPKKELSQPK